MPIRFQVDPDFYDHPKTIGMSDSATALWARAGSYSAAKHTDGFVAEHALSLLSRCPEEAASELVGRGLWRRVRGGFQFHQWDQRNLTRARIEADREADRDRKRAERHGSKVTHTVTCKECGHTFVTGRSDAKYCTARCRKRASRATEPQVETENVQPESRPESERNPDGVRPLSVSVSVSGSVSGSGHDPPAANGTSPPTASPEPPRTCPKHVEDPDPPPCGACADARRKHDEWALAVNRARAAERSATARQQAAAVRAAIDACNLCDNTGYTDAGLCHHTNVAARTTRGAAKARAALRKS